MKTLPWGSGGPTHSWASVLLLVAPLLLATGCHRSYYRRQADVDAAVLVAEKQSDPRWYNPEELRVEPDPRSRMYHPFSEDHPPMPPDDPTAAELMVEVDGKPGYPHWEANGRTAFVENPEWLQSLIRDEQNRVHLSMADAVNLARIHSRDYQRQLEELYLSALDVSLERFNFESQLFAGWGSSFTADGRVRGGGQSSSTFETGTGGRSFRLEKLGTAGTTIIVGLANSLVWQFSGPDSHSATTLVDFSIIQPLLRGAGRDRVMEALTLSERALLANVRQLERWRHGFHLEVTTGRNSGPGPSQGGARVLTTSDNTGSAGGYIGLLQTQQDIRIQESNIASLRNILAQFEAFFEADRVDFLQVQQSQTALFDAQSRLLDTRTNYQTALDRFKLTIGLPPTMELVVEDAFLDRFQFIDSEMTTRQNRLTDLQNRAGDEIVGLIDGRIDRLSRTFDENGAAVDGPPVRELSWNETVETSLERIAATIHEALEECDAIRDRAFPQAEADVVRLEAAIAMRRESLADMRQMIVEGTENFDQFNIEPEVLDESSLLVTPAASRTAFRDISRRLETTRAALEGLQGAVAELRATGSQFDPAVLYSLLEGEVFTKVPTQLTELAGLYLELNLAQVVARTETISLVPVEISNSQAIEIARRRRLDWMNARTALVDSWRRIEFVADQLEADFGLVFEGDLSNTGDNPLQLRDVNGRLRAGFQFDAPITRMAERNAYREALIQYHRARREYYLFEDEVARSLRQTLRVMEQSRLNFELSRRSVKVAVQQVELAGSRLRQPPEPGSTNNRLGATTARDLVSALATLQSAQLSFLRDWVGYEVLRRGLDFDLGTMQLDERGMWIDPGAIEEVTVERWLAESEMADQLFEQELEEVEEREELEILPELEGMPADGTSPLERQPSPDIRQEEPKLPDIILPRNLPGVDPEARGLQPLVPSRDGERTARVPDDLPVRPTGSGEKTREPSDETSSRRRELESGGGAESSGQDSSSEPTWNSPRLLPGPEARRQELPSHLPSPTGVSEVRPVSYEVLGGREASAGTIRLVSALSPGSERNSAKVKAEEDVAARTRLSDDSQRSSRRPAVR